MSDEEESASWEWNVGFTFDAFLLSLVFCGALLAIARFVIARFVRFGNPPQARDTESEVETAARIHHFWGEKQSASA